MKSEISKAWLNEREAANYLNMSRVTLFRLRARSELAYSKYGRLIRYRKQDLDEFMLSNHVHSNRQVDTSANNSIKSKFINPNKNKI